MTIFAKRLRASRESQNISPTALARRVGVSRAVLLDWEMQRAGPNDRQLRTLAEALRVGINWLCPVRFDRVLPFSGERLKMARHMNMLTQRDLAEALGVSASLISRWERIKATPSDEHVAALAVRLRVHEDFFFMPDPEPLDILCPRNRARLGIPPASSGVIANRLRKSLTHEDFRRRTLSVVVSTSKLKQ